jgi:hypothetical protein
MAKSRKKPLVFRAHQDVGGHHDPEILLGMARGVWADYWAQEQEEAGESFSGQDIYAAAPDAPTWAEKWAKKLANSIIHLNGDVSLDTLFKAARQAGFPKDRETFGFYLGMEAVGHGIHWTDNVPHSDEIPKILVPDYEFYEGAERSEPDLRFVHK